MWDMDHASNEIVLESGVTPGKTTGTYLYCLIEEAVQKQLPFEGIGGGRVYTVPEGDISAVVSDTEIMNFDRFEKNELLRHGVRHQQILEALLKKYDVVPFSFGMIVPGKEELNKLLKDVYLQFKVALQRIRGKVEFAIQIAWDEQKVIEEILKNDRELVQMRDQAALQGAKTAGLRLEVGKRIFGEVEKQRKKYLEDIKAVFRESWHDMQAGKLLEKDMIGNLALLVGKDEEPLLDATMHELGARYAATLKFKYIGPMAPYSFVAMNISIGNAELIANARKILGLDESANFSQIKKNYYQLARHYHPDVAMEGNGDGEEIRAIVEAYRIVEEYCRSCDTAEGSPCDSQQKVYSFRPEDVQKVFLIR